MNFYVRSASRKVRSSKLKGTFPSIRAVQKVVNLLNQSVAMYSLYTGSIQRLPESMTQ